MRKFPFFLVFCFVIVGAAGADPVMYQPGTGDPNIAEGGRDVCWSEPADLNGLIGSSEQILAFALETELANDFSTGSGEISHATWWSGLYNNYSCNDVVTTGFVLRFYDDAGCVPGTLLMEATPTIFQQFVNCQSGIYPVFKNDADIYFGAVAGTLYWFGAVQLDHAFPPQSGRVASAGVIGCDTVFKSAYFSYPDWTPAIDVFGVAFDCSQEFTCIGDYEGACCFGEECRILSGTECDAQGGIYQGNLTDCDPNPCVEVPAKHTTWSEIKGAYR